MESRIKLLEGYSIYKFCNEFQIPTFGGHLALKLLAEIFKLSQKI
jgi:hypothetical protein